MPSAPLPVKSAFVVASYSGRRRSPVSRSLGGPVGVALGAGAGGVVGYLTGNAVGIPREQVESIKQSLTPDSSALVVVLNDRWVRDVERDMKQAQARQVIAHQIAGK